MKVLHSVCQQIWKTQQWPKDGKRSVFIPIANVDNAKECSNYCTIALISNASSNTQKSPSQASTVMNHELPDVQGRFRKGRVTRDHIANICWIIKNPREFQKNIYFCFIDYDKAFDCVNHHKLQKILKEMGISDKLTCLLRNLYSGQEATCRTRHRTTHWFQIGKGVWQGCILSPAYLTYMQSTSHEIPSWMKHKLESRLLGEIWITLDMQMTPPLWQKVKKN